MRDVIRMVTVVGTILISAYVAIRYSYLTSIGEITPVFATWFFLTLGAAASFWTYWSHEKHSVTGNIGNTVSVVGNVMILATVVLFGRDVRYEFTEFELLCNVAVVALLVWWWLSSQHVATNLALQFVLTVAYFPMLYHLWFASENTEPLFVWVVSWFAVVLSAVPSVMDKDALAMVFAVRRWVIMTAIILLIIRLGG